MTSRAAAKHLKSNGLSLFMDEVRDYLQLHLVTAMIAAGLLVLFAVIIPGGMYYKKHVDKMGMSELDRGLALFEKAKLDADSSEFSNSQVPFQKIISSYALSSSTPLALLYMGNSFYQQGNYSEARRAYVRFLKKYPQHTLAGLAQYGVAAAAETSGDYTNAVMEYQKLIDNYSQFVTDDVRLGLAGSLEELARYDEARNIYDELASGNMTAKRRAARLKQK